MEMKHDADIGMRTESCSSDVHGREDQSTFICNAQTDMQAKNDEF